MSNEFWKYSLSTYEIEGLAQAALSVQDEMGLDINLILYASWLASCGLMLTTIHLEGLDSHIGRWQHEVVIPLRAIRRQLKSFSDVDLLRDRVKDIELESEKHQQQVMWEYFNTSEPLMSAGETGQKNLAMLIPAGTKVTAAWSRLVVTLCNVLPA
ncbi:MAG: hypothetical protein ACI9DH_001052 [Halioglobus sp.]|jgi:uncharacterized protein (TIGR02444 family)